MFQTSIYSFYGIIERLETKTLYTCTHLQLPKLQNPLQEVSCYALSLFESTCFNFDLYTIKVTMVVSSDLDPESSSISNQMRFVILISCDLEPDITPKYKNQYIENHHIWSIWTVATSSCPAPGRLSHQPVSVLVRKYIASCSNNILPTVIINILKRFTMDKPWSVKWG